jgi:hypothetical protein
MAKLMIVTLMLLGVAACASQPPSHDAAVTGPRVCSVATHEPCLDQVQTSNCVPC